MEIKGFENLKKQFIIADTDAKINIYIESDDLTQSQYKELLRLFPLNDLHKLEAALAS